MSLRAYTDSVDDYNRTHTLEIHKDGYSGSVDYLKNTGSGYASFDYEKIDPKNPTDNPIQKGALEFSLWLQSSALIDEIKTADEQTFWAIHKVDGTQEWQGYIYNDLSTYEEGFENHPFRITLMAKDFTDLGGKDYVIGGLLPDSRERVIATIAHLLDTVGFDMPIKTHTSWIEENLSGSYDYLNEIYHETKALRSFGRTGDETDQPITVEDALSQLCVTHGLLLKQANGAYWIDQLTEYDDPENVQEAEYNLSGVQQSLTTGNDLTVDANTSDLKVTIQQDNRDNSGLPGVKRVRNKFDHRTQITTSFGIPDPLYINAFTPSPDPKSYSRTFNNTGSQAFTFGANAHLATDDKSEDVWRTGIEIEIGGYWWNDDDGQWETSEYINRVQLESYQENNTYKFWAKSQAISTETIPSDALAGIIVTFHPFIDGSGIVIIGNQFEYKNISWEVINDSEGTSQSIDYILTQPDADYSTVPSISDTLFGDGPLSISPSALYYEDSDNSITLGTWQRRGSTSYRGFHENRLKEAMDVRRGWRRLLSATLKGLYYPYQILSYDSEYFYFIGGSWDLFTGNWEGELFSLDIETGSDTFDSVLKYTDETGSGSGSTSSGGGGGLDEGTANTLYFNEDENLSEGDAPTIRSNIDVYSKGESDNRYFRQSQALDELATADIDTALTNLGLKSGSRDLQLNSLQVDNNLDLFSSSFDHTRYNRDGDRWIGGVLSGGEFSIRPRESDWTPLNDGLVLTRSGGVNIAENLTVAGVSTFNGASIFNDTVTANDRVTAANGNLVLHENGYAYYDVAGENFSFMTDATTRNVWDIRRGSVGDIGSTNRLWGVAISNNDDLQFNPETGGGVDFMSDISNDNQNFTTGFLGNGWKIYEDASEQVIETDVGFFRSALFAQEFIINQILATQGSRIASAGRGKIENVVSSTSGSEVVEVSDPEGNTYASFVADDIVLCLQTRNDLDTGTVNVLEDDNAVITKRYVRKVSSVTGNEVTFTTATGAPNDAGSITKGDVIVVVANASVIQRQNLLYETVIEPNAPYTALKTGLDSWNAYKSASNLIMKYGNLNQSYGYTTGRIGFAVGSPDGEHATFDAIDGVRFIDGSGNVGAQFNSSIFKLGTGSNYVEFDVSAGTGEISIDDLFVEAGGTGFQSADFYLDSTAHRLSLGSVFSADGGSNEVVLSGFTADTDKLLKENLFGGTTDDYLQLGSFSTDREGLIINDSDYIINLVFRDGSGPEVSAFDKSASDYLFRLGHTNQIAGAFFDSSDMWAGAASKSNADIQLSFGNGWITSRDGTRSMIFDDAAIRHSPLNTTADALWLGYSPGFTELDGDALGLVIADIDGNQNLRSAITHREIGLRNEAGDRWVLNAHYQDGVTIGTVGTFDVDATTNLNGFVNIESGAFVDSDMIVRGGQGGRFVLPNYSDASRPSSPNDGELIYNTTTNTVQYWNGAWVSV